MLPASCLCLDYTRASKAPCTCFGRHQYIRGRHRRCPTAHPANSTTPHALLPDSHRASKASRTGARSPGWRRSLHGKCDSCRFGHEAQKPAAQGQEHRWSRPTCPYATTCVLVCDSGWLMATRTAGRCQPAEQPPAPHTPIQRRRHADRHTHIWRVDAPLGLRALRCAVVPRAHGWRWRRKLYQPRGAHRSHQGRHPVHCRFEWPS